MGGWRGGGAAAVVGAGEVRHWECCVKRVEASGEADKRGCGYIQCAAAARRLSVLTETLATQHNKTSSTAKAGPCGPDTGGDRNTYFWVALLYCVFFLSFTSAGRVSCLAERLRVFFPPRAATRRCSPVRGALCFLWGRGSSGGGGGGGAWR